MTSPKKQGEKQLHENKQPEEKKHSPDAALSKEIKWAQDNRTWPPTTRQPLVTLEVKYFETYLIDNTHRFHYTYSGRRVGDPTEGTPYPKRFLILVSRVYQIYFTETTKALKDDRRFKVEALRDNNFEPKITTISWLPQEMFTCAEQEDGSPGPFNSGKRAELWPRPYRVDMATLLQNIKTALGWKTLHSDTYRWQWSRGAVFQHRETGDKFCIVSATVFVGHVRRGGVNKSITLLQLDARGNLAMCIRSISQADLESDQFLFCEYWFSKEKVDVCILPILRDIYDTLGIEFV